MASKPGSSDAPGPSTVLEVATTLSERMGGQVPLALIALDPQVLEYGRALLDKKEFSGPSKISLRQILADVLEGARGAPNLRIEEAEPFPMVKLIRDTSGAKPAPATAPATVAAEWQKPLRSEPEPSPCVSERPRQELDFSAQRPDRRDRESSEQPSERRGRAWSDQGSDRREPSERSMSRPRLYKDMSGPPAAWQKPRPKSLARSQSDVERQDWQDSGSQPSWHERSAENEWTWKSRGWDSWDDSSWGDFSSGSGRGWKWRSADWGWDSKSDASWHDPGTSWDGSHKGATDASEASSKKRKLETKAQALATGGVILQVVNGVPVVSLDKGSDMDSNAAPILQAALENHARAESLYEQCDHLPEAKDIAHAARRAGIVKKLADIGIARARSEHPDCFGAGLQGKRSVMLALALALCSRDRVCLRRCLAFLKPLDLVDCFGRLMTESGLLTPDELKV